MFKKRIVIFVLGICIVGLLSGCTSVKSGASTYDKIKSSGEMTYAMTGAYPPFNYIGEDGVVTGFDIDIANAIAKKMGVAAKPITTDWDGIIGGLTGNRFDMIIGSMTITDERRTQVDFTDPYYYDGAQFFAKKGSSLKSIGDLKEGKVGVVTGTTFHDYLSKMDNIGEIVQFQSEVDIFTALDQGRLDGLVTSKVVGARAPMDFGVEIEPIGELLYAEELAIAVRKDDPKLLEELNKALKSIIEDGTYEKISNKWFGMNILQR